MNGAVLRVCVMVQRYPEAVQEYLTLHAPGWRSAESRLRLRASGTTRSSAGLELVSNYEYVGDDCEADTLRSLRVARRSDGGDSRDCPKSIRSPASPGPLAKCERGVAPRGMRAAPDLSRAPLAVLGSRQRFLLNSTAMCRRMTARSPNETGNPMKDATRRRPSTGPSA